MEEQEVILSVIVPVYNSEGTIQRCVDSLLNSTFKATEIILIDDGSTDHSGTILDDYAKKNENVIVAHFQNGGSSYARNRGIERAHGKFITFVDADD